MSARTKSARPASPIEVLTKLANVEQGTDLLANVIPAGADRVSAMLEQRGAVAPLAATAEALIRKAYRGAGQDLALSQSFALDESIPASTRDAVTNLQWMNAEAGFALGLALGMRLGGGR